MEWLLLQKPAIKIWEVWCFVFLEFGRHALSSILTLHWGVAPAALPCLVDVLWYVSEYLWLAHQGGCSWSTQWGLVSEMSKSPLLVSLRWHPLHCSPPLSKAVQFPLSSQGVPFLFFYFPLDFSSRVVWCAEGMESQLASSGCHLRTVQMFKFSQVLPWQQFLLEEHQSVLVGTWGLPCSVSPLDLLRPWAWRALPGWILCWNALGLNWIFSCYYPYSDLEGWDCEDFFRLCISNVWKPAKLSQGEWGFCSTEPWGVHTAEEPSHAAAL